MNEIIGDETWEIVNRLLSGPTNDDRLEALESLSDLIDEEEKDVLGEHFISLLKSERLEKQRAWIISGLGAIKRGEEVFKEFLDPDKEPSALVR